MSHRSEVIWLHAFTGKKDHQQYVIHLHQSRNGLELRACDFTHAWEKTYEGTVSSGMVELNELSDCLFRGNIELTEMSDTLKLTWGEHEAVLVKQSEVDVQDELKKLLVHSVEQMNTFKQNVQVLERKLGQEKLSSPVAQETSVIVKSGPAAKSKRLPGQSIINPLNKRKKAAGGVQFSDN